MLFREGERRPWVVTGSMGGDAQPQIHAQLVSALVDGGATSRPAVAAPRWFVEPAEHFAPPVEVRAEPRFAPGVARGARGARPPGHARPTPFDGGLGHAHAIELVDGGPAAGGRLARRRHGPAERGPPRGLVSRSRRDRLCDPRAGRWRAALTRRRHRSLIAQRGSRP